MPPRLIPYKQSSPSELMALAMFGSCRALKVYLSTLPNLQHQLCAIATIEERTVATARANNLEVLDGADPFVTRMIHEVMESGKPFTPKQCDVIAVEFERRWRHTAKIDKLQRFVLLEDDKVSPLEALTIPAVKVEIHDRKLQIVELDEQNETGIVRGKYGQWRLGRWSKLQAEKLGGRS